MSTTNSAHILVFPFPAQGHMLPLLDLTHQLALSGLQITILITPKNLPILNSLLSFHHPNPIQTLVLPFPSHPNLPTGVENLKDVGFSGTIPMIAALYKLEEPVMKWFESHSCPPTAILSDFLLGWTYKWAQRLGIPRVGFFSSGAFLVSIGVYLWSNIDSLKGGVYESSSVIEFPDLPRSPCIAKGHLPPMFGRYVKGDPDWELVREVMLANSKSWGCVFNSFHALEGEYLDHLRKVLGHQEVWVFGVGPLSSMGGSDSLIRVDPGLSDNRLVLDWLDKCPDGSVLYVCFGSQKELTQPQMEALAASLAQSMVRFMWVVKLNERVPLGFEERVVDRGLVVRGWAPQLKILHHRAVGGFMSHCGWNSVLESVEAGVMILGWPMEADQFLNGRLLVEDHGLAVRVCEGGSTVPHPDEFARVVFESINGNVSEKERVRVMRDKALEAVKAGGRSYMDLQEFVRKLIQKEK